MEVERFDRIARVLATPLTRRSALAAIVAGMAGTALGAAAGKTRSCRPLGAACNRRHSCCRGAQCRNKTCVCSPADGRCGQGCSGPGYCAAGTGCDPGDSVDVCAGPSTCTGRVNGRSVCCGVTDVHVCADWGNAYCCSGVCQASGRCG